MQNLISKIKQYRTFQIFTIFLRYVLGSSFVYASIFKIQGKRFTPTSGEFEPINSLAHLFETMYQSGIYWSFVGWGQLIAGFLLMSQIFSTVGAAAFFPILLNIFIITISFNSTSVLIITFLMLLGNIYLFIWDWNKWKIIVLPNSQNFIDDNPEFFKHAIWTYLGLIFFIAIIIVRSINGDSNY